MVSEATTEDCEEIARMLHECNLEFDEPTPASAFLGRRVRELISAADKTYLVACRESIGADDETVGYAQVDFRPTVWSDRPVATLEELWVRSGSRGHG